MLYLCNEIKTCLYLLTMETKMFNIISWSNCPFNYQPQAGTGVNFLC
jgi:hypothetical protein